MPERLTRAEAYAAFIELLREERDYVVETFMEARIKRGEGQLLEQSAVFLELQLQIEAAERALASMDASQKKQLVTSV